MQVSRQSGPLRAVSVVLISLILIACALISFMNAQLAGDDNRRQLRERAETIARALDANSVVRLSGTDKDAASPVYTELKARLAALEQVNTDARSIYLAGTRHGEVFFYVDSEQPGSEYYSPPGQAYPVATDAFRNMFSGTASLVEGPLRDSFGTWISGLAPLIDYTTGNVVAVIGIDVEAQVYNESVALAAIIPLGVGLFFITIILFYEWMRRRDEDILRLRSELVSVASHELRTPITGIRWVAEQALKKPKTDQKQAMESVYESILNLQSGVEDILQLIRVTDRKTRRLTIAPCDLRKLMEEVVETQRLGARQKQVEIIMGASWPKKAEVSCDAVKLKRALHNVVSNAVKYTQDHTNVLIEYEHTHTAHLIKVMDHGVGIPASEQGKVFSGFYRASNVHDIPGTGLGLYLTKTILEQHHGSVSFVSQEGAGTTFVLSLPNTVQNGINK